MKLRDRYGWPVEKFERRPLVNLLRLIRHTDLIATWRYRNWDGTGIDPGPRANMGCDTQSPLTQAATTQETK